MIGGSRPRGVLFTPLELGGLRLRNRVVASPHGTAHVRDGVPTEDDLAYWEARAAGGVGLIIVGGTTVHASGVLRDRRRAEPWRADALPALARRAEAVHRHGAAIFVQLGHLGREGVGRVRARSGRPIAAALAARRVHAHPLTAPEIEELIDAFATAAAKLKDAGHDGVELHAGHGYLIAQFLSAATNRRGTTAATWRGECASSNTSSRPCANAAARCSRSACA